MTITTEHLPWIFAAALPALLAVLLLMSPVWGLAIVGTLLLYASAYLVMTGPLALALLVGAAGAGACAAAGIVSGRR